MSDPYSPSDNLRMARQWIESGQVGRGVAQLESAVAESPDSCGPLRDLAWGLWWVERQNDALNRMSQAAQFAKVDPVSAYLSWRDLGLMRASVHRFEESLAALEKASEWEEKLPLPPPPAKPLLLARAEISLYANLPKQALELALRVIAQNGNAVPSAILVAAEARALQGKPPLEPFVGNLRSYFAGLVEALSERVQQGDPSILRHVASEMLDLFPGSIPDAGQVEIKLLISLVTLDGLVRDLPARSQSLTRLMAAYARVGDRGSWAQARLDWIRVQIDLGRLDGLELALEELEAIGIGEGWGSFHAASTRQKGRLEARKGNNSLAREAFRLAIQLARQVRDDVEAGRAEVVLGIQLFHEGDDTEAIRWIDIGLERLDPEDDHFKAGVNHRECIIDRKSCACFRNR